MSQSPTALMTDKTIKPVDLVQSPRSPTEPTGFIRPNRISEEHESLMQEFVHAHLMTILQPFSDQLCSLQESVQHVATQIPPVHKEVLQHREQLAQLQTVFPPLEKRDDELANLIQEVKMEVKLLGPKYDSLAKDHKLLKSCLEDADGRLRSAGEQIEDLMSGQGGVMARLQRLDEGMSEVEKHLSTVVESRLNYLHTFCKDLRTEQTTQLESMGHCQDTFNKQAEAMKSLRLKVSTKQAEDDEKFASLNQQGKGLDIKMNQLLPDIRNFEEGVKIQEKELQRVFQEMNKLRSMQQLYAEYSEIFISVKENTRRVAKLEDTMQVLSARNPVEQLHFQETIQRIQSQVDDNETRLQSVDRNQIAISGRIEQVAHSLEPFQPEIKSLERRCGVLDAEVQGLELWQHGSTEKFEEHNVRFQQQKSDLQKLQAEIDARGGMLDDLKDELAQTQRRLVRIDGNVDVMQKYFTGFGKGLQDTTRCVSAGEPLRTPRATPPRPQSATAAATGLPTLCGSGSPRRRPWSSKEIRSTRDIEC